MPLIAELANKEDFGDNSKTFVFENEEHTLGNTLKAIVVRFPEVVFCGYTVPHPGEPAMHFRIQAKKGYKAIDVLNKGLTELVEICSHVEKTFNTALHNFEHSNQMNNSNS